MSQFTPNPNVEVGNAFEVVKPGVYQMRVVSVSDFVSKSGNSCVKVALEFIDKSACINLAGDYCKNPGNVFDNGLVMSPAEKQGKLRSLVEACGLTWGSVTDTNDLIGSEVKVNVGIEEYNNEQKNVAKRYIK